MNQSSVGIIGGADGPTSIFLASSHPIELLVAGVVVVVGIGLAICWMRRK